MDFEIYSEKVQDMYGRSCDIYIALLRYGNGISFKKNLYAKISLRSVMTAVR